MCSEELMDAMRRASSDEARRQTQAAAQQRAHAAFADMNLQGGRPPQAAGAAQSYPPPYMVRPVLMCSLLYPVLQTACEPTPLRFGGLMTACLGPLYLATHKIATSVTFLCICLLIAKTLIPPINKRSSF